MDIKEFAKSISGKEYGYPQFTKDEIETAKENGFVIVYGVSDDLIELDGAMVEEDDCFNGGKIWICNGRKTYGLITDDCKCIEAFWYDKEALDESGNIIPWTYKTDIPHETFMIYEGGEPYCKGIVFSIEDLK